MILQINQWQQLKRFINNRRPTKGKAFLFSTGSRNAFGEGKDVPASSAWLEQKAWPVAAITFLEAELTDDMATAGEDKPWRGLAGLTEAGIAKYSDGHGVERQERLQGA